MFEQYLKNAGLSEKEARVYLAALEFGPMTVQQLARHTNIRRTTAYVQIASLIKQGFMSKTEKDGKVHFTAEAPESLQLLFKKQIKMVMNKYAQFKKIIPRLRTLAETAEDKPRVRFFEGKEGLVHIHKDILRSRAGSMDEFISIDPENLLFPIQPGDHRNRIAKRYKKIRVIYTSPKGPFLSAKEGLRERRFIPIEKFPFDGELVIYGRKVALVVPGTKKIGVLIEHRLIADMFRRIFELAWQEAGRISKTA